MQLVILGLLLILIILLIILLRKRPVEDHGSNGGRNRGKRRKNKKGKEKKPPSFCLLCGEELKEGKPIRTGIYPEDGKGGRLMEIYGCDLCVPPGASKTRKCPVCGSKLHEKQVLIARKYEEPGKNRVEVMGCSKCYRPAGY